MNRTSSPSANPANSKSTRLVGSDGERAAAAFLVSEGYGILDRNWRNGRFGELDLIAEKDGIVVFVEVKTRRGVPPDHALEAVDQKKLMRMRALGLAWLSQKQERRSCRFDVLGVQLRQAKAPLFAWLQDVGQ